MIVTFFLGFLLGAVLMLIFLVIWALLDYFIKTQEEKDEHENS